MRKIHLRESDKKDISNQYQDIDRNMFLFLLRRIKIEERELTSFLDDKEEIKRLRFEIEKLEKEEQTEENKSKLEKLKKELKLLLPLKVIEYSFEGYPGFGFNSYRTKKQMEKNILELLDETNFYTDQYEVGSLNVERQKVIKTVRAFLNFILPKE